MADQTDERLRALKASMKEALGKLTGSDELAAQGARERSGGVEHAVGRRGAEQSEKPVEKQVAKQVAKQVEKQAGKKVEKQAGKRAGKQPASPAKEAPPPRNTKDRPARRGS